MKTQICIAVAVMTQFMGLRAQPSSTGGGSSAGTNGLAWRATARDGVSITWEATEPVTNAVSGAVTNVPHRYVEIASGLNYLDPATGQYQPSQDQIELTADGGAAALHGPAKLYVKPNLNTAGAVTIVTASNRVFQTRPLGVFWYNAQSGQAVLVTPVQDCVGELVPPNQVVFKSAFGPLADLRLVYTKSGIESDLVLLQAPTLPAGWDPQTTRLELWHDWTGSPAPRLTPRLLYAETNATLRSQMSEPDLTDQILDFGDLWFPTGAAYATDGSAGAATNVARQVRVPNLARDPGLVGVAKTWLDTSLMTVLIEGVRWPDIQPKLASLPPASQSAPAVLAQNRSACLNRLPAPTSTSQTAVVIQLAHGDYRPTGVVLDYVTVPSSWNTYDYSFDTGTTYLVSSSTYFSSRVIFQPGCFIKFANSAYLLMYGSIVCNGSSSSPSILTSQDDDLYGYVFTWSTHYPSYAAGQAIWDYNIQNNVSITGMRIRWAHTGIEFDGSGDPYCNGYPDCCGQTNTVTECTLEFCQTGVLVKSCVANLAASTTCGVATPTNSAWTCQWCPTFFGSLSDIGNGSENGLSYLWEYQWFDHLGVDPNGDPDGDGRTNLQEYQMGTSPTHGDPPTITTQPVGLMVYAGGTAAFSAVAFPASASYRWWLNSKTLGNLGVVGTGPSYTRTGVQANDDGWIQADVYNTFGHAYSTMVSLVVPSSTALDIWNNYIANTNGKTINLWATRTTNNPPTPAWDQSSLLYGMTGFTAISQRNSFDLANGGPGVCAVTAITRRHGYMRGHGNGSGGYQGNTNLIGQKVWFCTANNQVVEAIIYSSFVRCGLCNPPYNTNGYDYGIVLFTEDLPATITPMPVMSAPVHFTVVFSPCQHGLMSANVPPFSWDDSGLQSFPFNNHYTYTNGDSGSPDMIPMTDGSLAMIYGRTTSGPSSQMQTDMNTLVTNYDSELGLQPGDAGYLAPANYQLNWHSYP